VRVLFITERFPPDLGGLATSSARTAGALARIGIDVDVLAWTKRLPPGALESGPAPGRAEGAPLHRMGLFSNWDLSLQHTNNVVRWLHAERAYDVVWGHYLHPAGFAAVLFAEQAGLRSVVSARGNDVDRMMFPPGDFARLQWTLERATGITAASEDLARKIRVLLGHDAPVEVVPNAVDCEVFRRLSPDPELRASLAISGDEAVLGYCGELRHKKGFPFMLDALRQVRRDRQACLLVVGEVRAREREHLIAFGVEDPDAAARIVVTGQLDAPEDVARHLALVDVYLQPSVWDGMPNALLEAMATERAVLTSDAGGIPEAVEHGVSGFIVQTAQLHRLGEATLELLELPAARRNELGRAARDRVVSAFNAEAEASALRRTLAL